MAIYNLYKENVISINIGSDCSEWKPINCGLRQGCPLSPLLFNIYINALIRHWRLTIHGNIQLSTNSTLDTLLYADDQVLLANTEDELQYSVHHLNVIAQNFNMEISTVKTKVMAFQGKMPIRSKICIGNSILEQVSSFKYLGYHLTYQAKQDIPQKIQSFNNVLRVRF